MLLRRVVSGAWLKRCASTESLIRCSKFLENKAVSEAILEVQKEFLLPEDYLNLLKATQKYDTLDFAKYLHERFDLEKDQPSKVWGEMFFTIAELAFRERKVSEVSFDPFKKVFRERLANKDFDMIFCAQYIRSCKTFQEFEEAAKVYNFLRAQKIKANSMIYSDMINIMRSQGKWEDGLQYFNAMQQQKIRPTSLAIAGAIRCMGECGYVKEALELFRKKADHHRAVFSAIINVAKDDLNMVESLWRKYQSVGSRYGDYVVLNAYFAALGKHGKIQKVIEIFDGKEGTHVIQTYEVLLRVLMDNKEFRLLDKYSQLAIKDGLVEFDQTSPRVYDFSGFSVPMGYGMIRQLLAKEGKNESDDALCILLSSVPTTPNDPEPTSVAIPILLNEYCRPLVKYEMKEESLIIQAEDVNAWFNEVKSKANKKRKSIY